MTEIVNGDHLHGPKLITVHVNLVRAPALRNAEMFQFFFWTLWTEKAVFLGGGILLSNKFFE